MKLAVEQDVEHNDENNLQDVPDIPDVNKANNSPGGQPGVHVVDESAQHKQGGHCAHEPVAEVIDINVYGQVGDYPKKKLLKIKIDYLLLV